MMRCCLTTKMVYVVGTGDDAGDYEVAQRVQVVVNHGVDGRNVELVVQQYEQLSEEAACGPRKEERECHLGLGDAHHRRVETEDAHVDPEEQQKRDEREEYLVYDILRLHSGEQLLPFEAVRE